VLIMKKLCAKVPRFKSQAQRAAHYRDLSKRTDATARRGRQALARDRERMERGPMGSHSLCQARLSVNEAKP